MDLPSQHTPILITTADPTGITLDEIFLRLPSGAEEVVWNGSAFRPAYASPLSTRTVVTADQEFDYSLRRVTGWPYSFELFVRVVDIDGNVTEESFPYAVPRARVESPEVDPEARRIGSDLTDEDGVANAQITDHEGESIATLITYFQDKPRVEALLRSWGAQNQEIESAFWALFTQRNIRLATGQHLDNLGEIVGEPRQDRTDEPYRAAIRVRILVNLSDGQPEQLITIAREMLGGGDDPDIQLTEHQPASMLIRVHSSLGSVDPADMARMLRQAKAAGVGFGLVVPFGAPRTFTWGSTPTSSGLTPNAAPTTGHGSTTDAAMGGLWTGVF